MGDAGSKERNVISLDCKESSEVHRPAWAQQSHAEMRRRAGDCGIGEGNRTSSPRGKPDRSGRDHQKIQSHGIIERAVDLVAGQARTLKAALEHRIETKDPRDARILYCAGWWNSPRT